MMLLAAAVTVSGACQRQDERLQQHREQFESLAASTAAIGHAWLSGSTSGTYTTTALEQMLLLLDEERSRLVSAPEALADPRGAALSKGTEQLSREIAAMRHAVRGADAGAVRLHLEAIETAAPEIH